MRKEFYKKLLPSQGIYCVTGIDPDGSVSNKFAENVDGLIENIERFEKRNLNVFVAPNSFKSNSRKNNALYGKSFFIDIDVGENKNYATKEEAIAALDKFDALNILPPPVRIDSGNGIHAYWILDKDIPIADWKLHADVLKTICLKHLHIDPVVTADAARIMRCPESQNYKSNPPKTSRFLTDDFCQWDYDEIKDVLKIEEKDVSLILSTIPKGMDEDTAAILKMNNYEHYFGELVLKSIETSEGCAQIRHIVEHPTKVDYNLWRAGLSIAWHCIDKDTAIHLMSEGHPTYDAQKTIAKAQDTQGKPQSCASFDRIRLGICTACPHFGKITNPLALVRKFKDAEEPMLPYEVLQGVQEAPVFPKSIFPFMRGEKGGIYFQPPPKLDKDGSKTESEVVLLWKNDVYPIKRMYGAEDGECLLVHHVTPNDGVREFTLPMSMIYVPDQLSKKLVDMGIFYKSTLGAYLMEYFRVWATYLQNKNSAEQIRTQMGWTEDNSAFVIGHLEISHTGERRRAASSPLVNSMAKLMRTEGSYEAWQKSANMLNEVGYEQLAFGLLAGFGSPLMRFTAIPGGTVCFVSGGTGHGKTGALRAGMSVFGDPRGSEIAGEKGSTDNGLTAWFVNLHSLLLGLDEISNKHAIALSNLIHNISIGKGKIRMMGSKNAIRELELPASLLACMTSNTSPKTLLESIKMHPEGEMARILEISVAKPPNFTQTKGYQIFEPFRTNFGYAGPAFIEYIYKIGEKEVTKVIDKWRLRFTRDVNDATAHRFHASIIAACMGGGELANRAGIIDLDLERIYAVVYKQLLTDTLGEEYNGAPIDYGSLIGEFINRNLTSILTIGKNGNIVNEPVNKLIVRHEQDTGEIYIVKSEFKSYMATIRVSSREFKEYMIDKNLMFFDGKKRMSAGYKAGIASTPVGAYGFKVDALSLEGLLKSEQPDTPTV